MKIFLQYKKPEDEDGFMMLKLTLNQKWCKYPISKAKKFFVDAYNKKYPMIPFTMENTTCYVFERALYDDEIIEDVCENMCTVMFKLGEPPKRPAPKEDHTGMVRCTNYGCNKWYRPEENSPTACHYHTAPPVFHDASKGWSCCQKRVYDWDEFNKIEGCTVGPHCCEQKLQSFAPSPTVAAINAVVANSPAPSPAPASSATPAPRPAAPVVRSIDEYNKQNPNAPTAVRSVEKVISEKPQPQPMKDGKVCCLHKGCNKWYVPEENVEGCCRYHKGNPVFHDGEKYWSCCPQTKVLDFDQFMKIPGCVVGKHDDGRE